MISDTEKSIQERYEELQLILKESKAQPIIDMIYEKLASLSQTSTFAFDALYKTTNYPLMIVSAVIDEIIKTEYLIRDYLSEVTNHIIEYMEEKYDSKS